MSQAPARWSLVALMALPATLVAIGAVVVATALSMPAGMAEASRHGVLIRDFVYDPSPVAARVGDVVTWTNMDIVPHTVTAEDGSWDSGEIGPGETWSMTVTDDVDPGYFCIYHPGMRSRLAIGSGS